MVNFEIYGDLNFLVLQLQTVFGHRLLVVLFISRIVFWHFVPVLRTSTFQLDMKSSCWVMKRIIYIDLKNNYINELDITFLSKIFVVNSMINHTNEF
jgi:hypothetical protein